MPAYAVAAEPGDLGDPRTAVGRDAVAVVDEQHGDHAAIGAVLLDDQAARRQGRAESAVHGVGLEILRHDVGEAVPGLEVRMSHRVGGQPDDCDLLERPVPRGEQQSLAQRGGGPVTGCRVGPQVAGMDVRVPAQRRAAVEQRCGERLVRRRQPPPAEALHGCRRRRVWPLGPDHGEVGEVVATARRCPVGEQRAAVRLAQAARRHIRAHPIGRWSSWISPMTPKPSLAYSSRGQSSAPASRKIRSSPWLRARAIACRTRACA